MKLHFRATRFAALALGLIFQTASVHAASVFDWDNITYAPAVATTTTKTALSTVDGNTMSIQFGNNTYFSNATKNAGTPASPASAAYGSGSAAYNASGGFGSQKALQILVDYADNTQFVPVTIYFSQPVVNVSFRFFDIDKGTVSGGGYVDQVRNILGLSTTGTNVVPTLTASADDDTTTLADAFTGTASNAQNSANGNGLVEFTSATPITQISFIYGDIYTATPHSTLQIIGVSDITFDNAPVPEPGTLAMAAAGIAGAVAVAGRSRHRQARENLLDDGLAG